MPYLKIYMHMWLYNATSAKNLLSIFIVHTPNLLYKTTQNNTNMLMPLNRETSCNLCIAFISVNTIHRMDVWKNLLYFLALFQSVSQNIIPVDMQSIWTSSWPVDVRYKIVGTKNLFNKYFFFISFCMELPWQKYSDLRKHSLALV